MEQPLYVCIHNHSVFSRYVYISQVQGELETSTVKGSEHLRNLRLIQRNWILLRFQDDFCFLLVFTNEEKLHLYKNLLTLPFH
jgi:hypothetical protein